VKTRVSAKHLCAGLIPAPASENMRKPVLILAIFSTLLFLGYKTSHAQAFDFNKAYQDYQYALTVYQGAYATYQDSRDFYLKNPTLTLKEDARQKTLAMLKDRDQLSSVYLTMLRMKLVETSGLSIDDKNSIFGKIDPEVKWYQTHLVNYQDGDPLETLFSKSDEAQNQYTTNTLPVIYESLFDISLGAQVGIENDMTSIYSNLKDIVNARVAGGKLDINPFNRWFSDIDGTIQTFNQNNDLAKSQIAKISGQYYSVTGSFGTSTDTLAVSLKSLTQLNNFLIEVLTSLKNQQ
jgi:hypothetical protein